MSVSRGKFGIQLKDIIVIVLFATLANVDDWVEMAYVCGQLSWSISDANILN